MAITDKTRKILWGRSGNRCAICQHELVINATSEESESIIGEECHIISAQPYGPRYDSSYPQKKLDTYENLILLCRIHHKIVDDQSEIYTAEKLRGIKKDHELRVTQKLDNISKDTRCIQKPYVETPHKQMIRELARHFQDTMQLPWVGGCFIPELKPGQVTLSDHGLLVRVTKDKLIEVPLNIEPNLRGHLLTGGFTKTIDEIELWKQGVEEYLLRCHALLTVVSRRIEKTYGVSIPLEKDSTTNGFLVDFPITICADAVDQARGGTHFKYFSYRYENLGLRFGAFLIYQGVQNEDVKPYEELHKELRNICAKRKTSKNIAIRLTRINQLNDDIGEQLRKFADLERVCGHCDLCST